MLVIDMDMCSVGGPVSMCSC